MRLFAASFLFLSIFCGLALAAPGNLDQGFLPEVYTEYNFPGVEGISVHDNGNILAGGGFFLGNSIANPEAIKMISPEGQVVPPFAQPVPLSSVNNLAGIIARQWDDKVLIAGRRYIGGREFHQGLVRLNADGTVDQSFVAQVPDSSVTGLALQADGKILIGGTFQTVNGTPRSWLARLNMDGSLDESFSPVVNNEVFTLAIQPDQKILVGGSFSSVNGSPRRALARLKVDGNLDALFNANLEPSGATPNAVYCIVVHPLGELTIGGSFRVSNGNQWISAAARLQSNGSLPKKVAGGTLVTTGALQVNGKLNVVSYHDYISKISQLLPNGDIDTSFASSLLAKNYVSIINAVALQGDGKVLVGMTHAGFHAGSDAYKPLERTLVRLANEPASDTLRAIDGARLEWLRGGSAPEALAVRFEVSADGTNWQLLGEGTRISGGWMLDGLALPETGFVRGRARTCGGRYNASYGIVGRTIDLGEEMPQIVLESPDASHTDDLGSYYFAGQYSKTFKIRNSGSGVLRLHGINFNDFFRCEVRVDTQNMDRTLLPGEETSFNVIWTSSDSAASVKMVISSNAQANEDLQILLTGSWGPSPIAELGGVTLTGYDKIGNPVVLPLDRFFVPSRTYYQLRIPSDRLSADLILMTMSEFGGVVKVNGQQIAGRYSWEVRMNFDVIPKPIIIEVQSPDGQNWKTYTINVFRSAPKPGDVNLGFAPTGHQVGQVDLIQPDGKIVFAGGRLNMDGTADVSFQSIGGYDGGTHLQADLGLLRSYNSYVHQLRPDGTLEWAAPLRFSDMSAFVKLRDSSILVANSSSGSRDKSLKKLSPVGVLDTSYVSPVNGWIGSMLELPDGRILICGQLTSRSGLYPFSVGCLYPDGSMDDSYPVVSCDGPAHGMIRQPDGKILIYGDFNQVSGQPRQRLARLNADGSLDSSFVPMLLSSARIFSAVLQADGKILLAGNFGAYNLSSLALQRLNADGSRDTTLEGYRSGGSSSIHSVAMEKNGSIIYSGNFVKFNQVPRAGLVRIVNNAAQESLMVPDATRVKWERSGAAPEALKVYFECRTDGGAAWTWLGQGTYMGTGWELTGLNLPPTGQVRARAVLQSGYHSSSRGMIESLAEFSFAPAAMMVETAAGNPWVSGATADFGSVGLGGLSRQAFVLKNTGETRLNEIRVEIEGGAATDFRLQSPVQEALSKTGVQSLVFQFDPTLLGTREAVAKIYSSAMSSTPFRVLLKGTGIKGNAPVVKTLAATGISLVSAELKGTVNAKGLARGACFEYGTTKNLGSLLEILPATVEGTSVENVQATVNGLLPQTRYYFRIRAASVEGGAVGATLTFVTGTQIPVARPDRWVLLRGPNPLALDVLANDGDPGDGILTMDTFSQLTPAGGGTLSKSGNLLLLAGTESPGDFSFIYQVKNERGVLSEPTTVNVRLTSSILLSSANSGVVSAAGRSYPLSLETYSSWKLVNPMPWVQVDVTEGFGDRQLQITVLPNITTQARSGVINIGYVTHNITQAGVLLPVLGQPGLPLPPAYVGAAFELPIPTQNLPVTYTVKNLPPGLTISGITGVISGVPTQAGRYAVSIKARNIAGTAVDTVLLDLLVAVLPQEFQGRHEGVISLSDTRQRSLGGRYELTVTATGAFTGKVTQGSKTEPMKGTLAVAPHLPTHAVGTATLPGGKTAPLRQFRVNLQSTGDGSHTAELLMGGVPTGGGQGWRIPWNGKDRVATAYAETYSFVTPPVESVNPAPEGHGYGTFTVAGKTGAVKITGRLADGTPYISSAFVSGRGDIAVYQALYSQGGALVGALAVATHEERELNGVLGRMDWVKHPVDAKSKDLAYRSGFGPLALTSRGGVLPRLAPGGRILDLPGSVSAQAQLKFSGGGLPAPFDASVTVTNASAKGLTNKAAVATTAEAVALPQVDAKKGTFSGSFTLPGSAPTLDRKTAFSGQVVQIEGEVKGYGFFMMPELPAPGGSLKAAPRQSGAVLFQAAPPP